MKKLSFAFVSIVTLLHLVVMPATSVSAASDGQIMYLLDASSSMLAKDGTGTTRIDKAKQALRSSLSSIDPGVQVGLRVYGSEVSENDEVNGCKDTTLISSPKANNASSLVGSLDSIQAKGWTLMGTSLQAIQNDFTGEGPKSVILLSDGIDTCTPPEACEVAKNLMAAGVKLKINTLGLMVDDRAKDQLSCIAENSGGTYFDVTDLSKLQTTLNAVTEREVALFTLKGVPIKGSLRYEDAPSFLADTYYTDSLLIPQEKYYSLSVLPNQKVRLILTTTARDTSLGYGQYIEVNGQVEGSRANITTYPVDEAFKPNGDAVVVTYEFDSGKIKGFSKASDVVFKVSTRTNNAEKFKGTELKYELRAETTGGDRPNITNASKKDNDTATQNSSPSTLQTVGLTLLAVAIMSAIGYGIWRIRRRPTTGIAGLQDSNQHTGSDESAHSQDNESHTP